MHYYKIQPNEINIGEPDNQGWWLISHKDPTKGLKFRLRYNAHVTSKGEPDSMMEFQIIDADRNIGNGAQFTNNPNSWMDRFIFQGYFNVWLSQRKMV